MRKQTKIAAIVSAAALLAIGASMTSFANSWKETSTGSDEWVYVDRNGDVIEEEGWHRGNSEWTYGTAYWYYADIDGVMVRDSVVLDGENTYYVGANGAKVLDTWVEVADSDYVGDGWYYFNATTGKAVKADSGLTKASVRKSNTDDTKGNFLFDEEGAMQLGWQTITTTSNGSPSTSIYYCVQEGDEYDITVEDTFNFVEGQALTGWAYMQIADDMEADSDDDVEDGYAWFYFQNGGAYKDTKAKYLSWKGSSAYYYFNDDGIMRTSYTYGYDNGTAANADVYMTSGAVVSGNQWIYDTDDSVWYYLVNIKKGTNVTRGVKFNDGGTKTLMKYINGQLYAFDTNGKMLVGEQDIPVNTDDDWQGVSCVKVTEPVTYYFNKTSDKQASTAGRRMEGKITWEDSDTGLTYTKYYTDKGYAMNAVYGNYLYGDDGDMYVPEDGSSYEIYYGNVNVYLKNTNTKPDYTPTAVLVKKNGSVVKTFGSKNSPKTINGEKYYVANYQVYNADGTKVE